MKKLKKKLIVNLIIVLLIFPLVIPIFVYSKVTNYLATGDSIAFGYGLPDIYAQSYAQIVRNNLGVNASNFNNLSVSGMTCQEYYSAIQASQFTSEIEKADLLTVSIGSNELLELVTGALSDVTGIPANDPAFLDKVKQVFAEASLVKQMEMVSAIYTFFTSQETKDKMNQSISVYQEYWDKSVKYIKSVNQNINIIATEFYNPYYEVVVGTLDLGGFVDEFIVKMNQILNERSNNESDYKVAKIYDAFNTTNPRLTNVNIDIASMTLEMDPHPNVAGHQMIASKVMDAYATIQEKTKSVAELTISDIPDQIYTGSEIKPHVIVKDGTKVLTENTDYTLVYSNNTAVGEAKVNIVGMGNYAGNVIKTFNIKGSQSEKKSIVNLSYNDINNQIYSGVDIKPDVVIKDSNYLLIKDKDYTLSYMNNNSVGTATVVIKGIGNYTEQTTKSFKITPKSILDATVSDINAQVYTGSEIKPSVVVYNGSIKLIENKDYNVEYANNVQVGNATIKITGINNYTGTVSKSFIITETGQIVKKDISSVQCSTIDNKIYTGKLITPEVVLMDGEQILTKNVDYKLTYKDNIDVGIGKLIITGMGDYTGEVEKSFTIIKKDINHTYVDDIPNQKYIGNEIKPIVNITNDTTKLQEGVDYTIEYKNNTNIGTGQAIITGINNFEGTMIKTFNIVEDENNHQIQPKKEDTEAGLKEGTIEDLLKKDNTVSNKKIPQTGETLSIVFVISILIIAIIGLKIWLNKNKNI